MLMISDDDEIGFDPEMVRSLIEQMDAISPMDVPSSVSLEFEDETIPYDVPDAEPVAGFSLLVADDGSLCHFQQPIDDRYTMPVLRLTDETKEWCDTNLKDRYWFFSSTHGFRSFYFTTERDYIIFKMRYG